MYTRSVLAYLRYRNFSSSRVLLLLCRILNKIQLCLIKIHPNVSYLRLRHLRSMVNQMEKYLLRLTICFLLRGTSSRSIQPSPRRGTVITSRFGYEYFGDYSHEIKQVSTNLYKKPNQSFQAKKGALTYIGSWRF